LPLIKQQESLIASFIQDAPAIPIPKQ